MAQRLSGYDRIPDEAYPTSPSAWWTLRALFAQPELASVEFTFDPCDRANGMMVTGLRTMGIEAIGNRRDFLTLASSELPFGAAIVCNPPYGRGGRMARAFIEHALKLDAPLIAMLLRNDFDSGRTRQHLFRRCPSFAFKLVLLNRIKWFEGPSEPSDNHTWFVWRRDHSGPPTIRYITRSEVEP